ncbi:MAG: hypothetical protein KGN16_18735 [Burkholderiales bacterium]|nr:hypothetical protein [Burkholderiales bacterium]
MTQYRVSHVNANGVALQDSAGRHHLAMPLHRVLKIGDVLRGLQPRHGFAVLLDSAGRTCRVIFEAINCSQQEVALQLQCQR